MRERGEKITMLTAYDATFAAVADSAGVECLLIGDSLGMVIQGHDVDFRAAVQPTVWGENFVLRILDRRKSIVPLDQMGLAADRLGTLRLMLARAPWRAISTWLPRATSSTSASRNVGSFFACAIRDLTLPPVTPIL